MDERNTRKYFSYLEEEQLTFTKKDREITLVKIREQNKVSTRSSILQRLKRHFFPLLSTVAVLMIAITLLLPYSPFWSSTDLAHNSSNQANQNFSLLLMSDDSNRHISDISMLITYSMDDNSMNIVPIPRDLKVDIYNANGEREMESKYMISTSLTPTPEAAVVTSEQLFEISIDYYAMVSLEKMLEVADIREATPESFTIDSNVYQQIDRDSILSYLRNGETDLPIEQLEELENDQQLTVNVVSMENHIKSTVVDGVYYDEVDKNWLVNTREQLKQHLNKE
ncbi:LCP family glycopolymer transferase [Paraliobacillus ryukyuensis]|uniref:LCP family glycopolymer transferase n=1 Tax=Paraliobacillus ryukyuensis TaxID=200904 RepID=UPI0009A79AE8|nr:LCP family protein [Paraliobacillus ryukyuensis]